MVMTLAFELFALLQYAQCDEHWGLVRGKPDSVRRFRRAPIHLASHGETPAAISLAGAAYPESLDGPPDSLFCLASDWVYSAAAIARRRGGLLLHLFTLTRFRGRFAFCYTGRQSAFRRSAPAFTGNPALRCPDFPLADFPTSGRFPLGTEMPAAATAVKYFVFLPDNFLTYLWR